MPRKPRPKPLPLSYSPEEQEAINKALDILGRRVRDSALAMTDPNTAGQYAQLRLGSREQEVFACIWLDARHRVIECDELFFGTVDGAEVHPREVVRRALQRNAAAVILAHNHPSGSLDPSAADRAVTTRLKEALRLIDVRVLDHFIVSEAGFTSMARLGQL